MTGLWIVTGAALAVAVVGLLTARRTAKRLAQLTEMYWELKYQHLELRKQLEGAPGVGAASAPVHASEPPARPNESFVPLTSLRR
jgi:hypothetical protein